MARSGETGLSLPVKYFTDRSNAALLLRIFYVFSILCLSCLCACLFICALWSPAGKGPTSWLSFVVSNLEIIMLSCLFVVVLWSPTWKGVTYVMFSCVFITFPCGVLGQVWYLIVSIPDLCTFTYFNNIFHGC